MKSLRERKKSETRRRLAVAAVDLLIDEGDEGATVAAIAERAGVSARTFHNYFPKRDDAYLYFVDVVTEEWEKRFETLPADDGPVRNVRTLLTEMLSPSEGNLISPVKLIQLGEHIAVLFSKEERMCAKSKMRGLEDDMVERYSDLFSRLELQVLLPALFAGAGVAIERSIEDGAYPIDYVNQAFDFFEERFGK